MKKLFLILLFLFLFAGYADAANMAYFNGSNSYINATANVDSGIYPMWDDYKFEFSIKLSPGTSSQNIFQWSDLSTGFIISVGTDGLLYVTHNDTDWHSVSRVDDNDLHSIIVQRVSSAFSIIIDTEEDATGTDSYDISTGTGNANTFIGGTYLYGYYYKLLNGYISNFKYTRAGTDVRLDLHLTADVIDSSPYGVVFANHSVTFQDPFALPRAYTVTYNSNGATGGSAPVDSNSYATGTYAMILDNTNLTKPNSHFTKWNTVADGSGTDFNADEYLLMTKDTTLYVQWGQGLFLESIISTTSHDGTYLDMSGGLFYTDMSLFQLTSGQDFNIVGNATAMGVPVINACLYFPIIIPANSTILTSNVYLYGKNIGFSATNRHIRVRFEKTLTPTAFSTLEDYLPRLSNLTTAYVDWSTPVTEAYSISDDISVPFHEAIGTGATTGVAIHFLENGSDNVSGFGFAGANYEDGGEYHPAVLMVTYTSTPSTTMKMPWYHNN